MEEELNTYLEKLVKEHVFPGCNWCVITKDDTFYGSVGYKALKPKKITNDINNLYDIASITKLLVTNTLIAFLLRDDKIRLDNYVKDFLPDFPFDDVRIIHLLTHSSGIIPKYDKNHLQSKDEFITNIALKFSPGTDVLYVDNNFILLGFIVEKIYGKPLDVLAQELIFKPLKMNDTYFCPSDKERCVPTEITKQRGLIQGVVHDEKAAFLDGVAGHAGVFSTIGDISHFIQMILNDGFYQGKAFIESNYLDLWFQPLFINGDGIRRTIGWIYGKSSSLCKSIATEDMIVHTGFPGHHIVIDRSNDIAIIFLSNSIHPKRENKEKLISKREEINREIYRLLKKYNYLN